MTLWTFAFTKKQNVIISVFLHLQWIYLVLAVAYTSVLDISMVTRCTASISFVNINSWSSRWPFRRISNCNGVSKPKSSQIYAFFLSKARIIRQGKQLGGLRPCGSFASDQLDEKKNPFGCIILRKKNRAHQNIRSDMPTASRQKVNIHFFFSVASENTT